MHAHETPQFGWSVFTGGSKKQISAKEAGLPYRLSAWDHVDGRHFYEWHLKSLLPAAWATLVELYPKLADKMLRSVPKRWGRQQLEIETTSQWLQPQLTGTVLSFSQIPAGWHGVHLGHRCIEQPGECSGHMHERHCVSTQTSMHQHAYAMFCV